MEVLVLFVIVLLVIRFIPKAAKQEFKEGYEEGVTGNVRAWYSVIPDTFNKYQDVCVRVLQWMNVPKMVIVFVVLTNLFFYLFTLLSIVLAPLYFVYRGVITLLGGE